MSSPKRGAVRSAYKQQIWAHILWRVLSFCHCPDDGLPILEMLWQAVTPSAKSLLSMPAAAHGIPWRRGYLFHGPPGSGKTSLVTALAGRLHKSIYVINLSSPAMNDEVRQVLHGPGCATSGDSSNWGRQNAILRQPSVGKRQFASSHVVTSDARVAQRAVGRNWLSCDRL